MSAREIPSNILRDALLEYSRERKRKRSRRRDRWNSFASSSSNVDRYIQEVQQQSSQTQSPAGDKLFSEQIQLENARNTDALEKTKASKSKTLRFEPLGSEETYIVDERQQKSLVNASASPQVLQLDRDDNDFKAISREREEAIGALLETKTSALYFDKVDATPSAVSFEDTSAIKNCPCPCSMASKYHVPPELKDGNRPVQTSFIQKVFMILLVKTIVMVGWLKTVEFLDGFRIHYENHFQYHCIAGAAYVMIKLIIRTTRKFRTRHSWMYVILYLFEIIAASDFLACVVTYWFDGHFSVPRRVLYCILGTLIFFIFVGAFVTYDMQDGIMMGAAFIVTAIIAVHQFIHSKTNLGLVLVKFHTEVGLQEVVSSLTVLGISELVMTIIMFELRSVLTGQRYSLSSDDWFFTAVYVI